MPAADKYLTPNDRTRDEMGGDRERKDRDKSYKDNYSYYTGEHPEWLIQESDDPVNDNVTINVTKQSIDRTLSFLFPDLPIFQLDKNADTELEVWLNKVWLLNGGAYLLSTFAQYGALSGHCYARVIRSSNDIPRIVPINPCVPITYWKSDDFQTVVWHEFKYTAGKTETIIDFVNNTTYWSIYKYTRSVDTQTFIQEGEEEKWTYYVPPVIDWQHLPEPGKYYGRPEITKNTRQLNDYINRVASDIGKILRYHAFPKTVATGTDSVQAAEGIDGMYVVGAADAKIYNVEMQSDLASSMSYLNFLNESFLSLSRVVIMKGTVKDFQRVTNTGIRAVFLDMIAKNQILRWTYGIGLQKICQAIMFTGNKLSGSIPSVTWADPLPTDELELVNKYAIEQGNGWNDPESISKALGNEWDQSVKNWVNLPQPIKDLILGQANPQGGQATRLTKTQNNQLPV